MGELVYTGLPEPNLKVYDDTCKTFSWSGELQLLKSKQEKGGINIGYLAVDKHCENSLGDHTALRWLKKDGTVINYSYQDLKNLTSQFANVLKNLKLKEGECVFSLAGRIPDLYIAALGSLKYKAVFCPLFSAFGPEPVFQRLNNGAAKVLVTTSAIFEKKIKPLLERLPTLEYILLTDIASHADEKILSLPSLMNEASEQFEIAHTEPEDPALLHFTSGTTGMPKGAIHAHSAVLVHYVTGKYVLDFHPEDIFWCTADPGWVTGTSYGIIAPLVCGITNIIDEEEFDAIRWYNILEQQKISIWYTAPTAIRRLMRIDIHPLEKYNLKKLRLILSVGEPLNPEAVRWGEKTFGVPVLDNWWQTETGGIMIANYRSMKVKPGSMGKSLPGIEAAIATIDETGIHIISEPGKQGHLVIKKGWPSMFRTYLHQEERYQKCFQGDWYDSGDLAKQDEDGYFWFVGRGDDIIKTSGHMVGPFEVESVLMEHPSVAESAVIGIPHPLIGELVKAFVVLKPGQKKTDDTGLDIIGFARKKLGPAVAPKEITFVENLPKTRSGKILRRLLKSRELGLPEGDISTLEAEDNRSSEAIKKDAEILNPEHLKNLLFEMKRIRVFEERSAEMYSKMKIRGFLHLYIGEEAVATGILKTLSAEDNVLCTYREHGHALVRGIDAGKIMAEMYGKVEGCCRGRGGSMHLFDVSKKFYGGNAIVGGHLPLAVGLALAAKKQNRDEITVCFFGEGAMAEGTFHESMNLAALLKVRVLFVCENNQYAMGTALKYSHAATALERKGDDYGIASAVVDGMDVLAVEQAAQKAIRLIRESGSPFFLVCNTYRFKAHSMFDAELYRDKSEVEEWKKRDPILSLEKFLSEKQMITASEIGDMDKLIETEIQAAIDFAEKGTFEPTDQLTNYVCNR